jgi:hypothetical protein
MTVYVDDVRHQFGRMIMCHCWADTLDELLAMMDRIGVDRKWIQQPPKASWVHFDISLAMKAKAIAAGAVLTDKYGPVEHTARLAGNTAMLERVAKCRTMRDEKK